MLTRSKAVAIVDWALRITGVLSFIAVSFLYVQSERRNDCQSDINQQQLARSQNLDADLTREREASRRVDDALAAIVAASLAPTAPLEKEARRLITDLSVALAAQARARTAADEARRANPPIPTPATAC